MLFENNITSMKKLDFYILKQLFLTFVIFLFIFTIILWINRAIRLFDRIIADGHRSSVLLEFALLSVPSIASIVFPLACFATVIFVTNRLKNDAEITILYSSGLSSWRLLKPYLIFGVLSMLSLSVFTTFLAPSASKKLHEKQIELDSSVSARLLKNGKFLHPIKGVTFYVKEIKDDGTLSNIFLHDKRSEDELLTYTATHAFLAKNENKTVLYMENGLIQTFDNSRKELSTTKFKSITIDLSDSIEKRSSEKIHLSHVSTFLLLKNSQTVVELTSASRQLINLELHTRLHRSIFCLVATVLGFSTLILGNYNRLNLSKQIALAISIIVLIKIIESYTIKIFLDSFAFWLLLYLPSLLGVMVSILFLAASNSNYRRKFRVSK